MPRPSSARGLRRRRRGLEVKEEKRRRSRSRNRRPRLRALGPRRRPSIRAAAASPAPLRPAELPPSHGSALPNRPAAELVPHLGAEQGMGRRRPGVEQGLRLSARRAAASHAMAAPPLRPPAAASAPVELGAPPWEEGGMGKEVAGSGARASSATPVRRPAGPLRRARSSPWRAPWADGARARGRGPCPGGERESREGEKGGRAGGKKRKKNYDTWAPQSGSWDRVEI